MWISREYYNFLKKHAEKNIERENRFREDERAKRERMEYLESLRRNMEEVPPRIIIRYGM